MGKDWFSDLQTVAGPAAGEVGTERDWFSDLQPNVPAAAPASPAGGESPSLVSRAWQAVKGKQDPAHADLPSIQDAIGSEGLLLPDVEKGKLAGAGDAAFGDIIQKSLGDKFIGRQKDANGYDIIRFKGKDGSEKAGYVNRPGLDTEDVGRVAVGAIPYLVGGGAVGTAMKGAPLAFQAAGQGVAAGATNVAGQAAQSPLGSEQDFNPTETAIAAGAGVAGPFIGAGLGALWNKFVTVPGLYNKASGKLTEKGAEAAKAAGLNPDEIEGEIAKVFAQTYAKTGKASEAAIKAQEREFGIPSTVGQRTKDPQALTQEEAMRRGLYGDKAKQIITDLDQRQGQAVDLAARTKVPSMVREEAGAQGAGLQVQAQPTQGLGESIQSGISSAHRAAKAQESVAWESATDILPKPEAFDLLPHALSGQLGGLRVTAQMEKAAAMAKSLDDYVAGKAFEEPVASVLKQTPVKTVDEMRRQLLAMYKGAKDPTDVKAAKAIYDGFNDWIEEAAQAQLVVGRPEAAAALVAARDVSKTMNGLFNPMIKGHKAPAANIINDILENGDTPERVISTLFGGSGPTGAVKDGAVPALKAIRGALYKYGDRQTANDTWADMGIAYWQRLVQNKRGDPFPPGTMLNNIKTALSNQKSIVDTLYGPKGMAQMRKLVTELDRIVYKPPNASGSGYTAAHFAKEFFGKVFEAFGGKSTLARAALERSGLVDAYGAAAAGKAVDQTVKAARPRAMAPLVSAAGAEYGRQDQ